MHLMVQPEVAGAALNDRLLRDQGFLTRILLSNPTSLIGTRVLEPRGLPGVLQDYRSRLLALLEGPFPLEQGKRNELAPRTVPFSNEAAELFRQFSNAIERVMPPGETYGEIQGFAAKLAEHAARARRNDSRVYRYQYD
jgi:Protein of unknown function (DUF3987)